MLENLCHSNSIQSTAFLEPGVLQHKDHQFNLLFYVPLRVECLSESNWHGPVPAHHIVSTFTAKPQLFLFTYSNCWSTSYTSLHPIIKIELTFVLNIWISLDWKLIRLAMIKSCSTRQNILLITSRLTKSRCIVTAHGIDISWSQNYATTQQLLKLRWRNLNYQVKQSL